MEVRYFKEYSRYLNRDMEFKVYGSTGRPCLVFPCQGGRFWDWEDFGMCQIASPWIDSGKLMLITCDSIDKETWDNPGDCRQRIEQHERWYNYICKELVPRINELCGHRYDGQILLAGTSMGAAHAVNFFLRRPDLFNGTIALSGFYDTRLFFGEYMDDLTYRNSPVDYMRNIPTDHPYIEMINRADQFIVCVGQGAWEGPLLDSTRQLQGILESKGVRADVEIWGYDVCHDWNWWKVQWPMFLGRILDK